MKENRLTVEGNMGLVYTIARKMLYLTKSALVEWDDLVSDGTLGLIYAVKRFDANRGSQFSSYACAYIRGFILQGNRNLFREHWRARATGVSSTTFSMHLTEQQEFSRLTSDCGDNAQHIFETVHRSTTLRRIRKVLTPRQLQVLELLTEEDRTHKEVGKILGIGRAQVGNCYRKILTRAKEHLALQEAT